MSREPRSVVLEVDDRGGSVVAIVEADQLCDGVLCRAIDEAVRRSGELTIIQLADDTSAVRRRLAQAVLRRDVAWWSRDRGGVTASIDTMDNSSLDDAGAWVRQASCVVMLARTMETTAGAELLSGVRCIEPHAWPHASVVATDHAR